MNLFYIGNKYYNLSSTMMPPLYEEKTGRGSDWGEVMIAVRNGETVTIRPATTEEKAAADKLLASICVKLDEIYN